jgi:hypothetical protein
MEPFLLLLRSEWCVIFMVRLSDIMFHLHRMREFVRSVSCLAILAFLTACSITAPTTQPTAASTALIEPTAVPPTTPAAEPTAAPVATAESTAVPTPAVTAEPTTLPAETPAAEPAGLVYVDQGKVFLRQGDELTELASVPEGVLGATLIDSETLLLVQEQGLVRLPITSGVPEPVLTFDRPAVWGTFLPTGTGQLLYAAAVSEPESVTEFGMGTRIGVYNLNRGDVRQILSEPAALELLGVTDEGILVMPRGQDPAFGTIEVRSLDDGTVIESLEVHGEGFAAISPDGRWAAISSRQIDAQGNGTDQLLLYDLTARPVTARTAPLPHGGAAAAGVWARDGSRFFFSYGPGNLYMLEGSYGLWALNPQDLSVAQVADVDVKDTRIDGISPAGVAVVRKTMTSDVFLVNTADGNIEPAIIPPSAIVAEK